MDTLIWFEIEDMTGGKLEAFEWIKLGMPQDMA